MSDRHPKCVSKGRGGQGQFSVGGIFQCGGIFQFSFPGAPYQIFLLFLSWLPCHFYVVVIEKQLQNIMREIILATEGQPMRQTATLPIRIVWEAVNSRNKWVLFEDPPSVKSLGTMLLWYTGGFKGALNSPQWCRGMPLMLLHNIVAWFPDRPRSNKSKYHNCGFYQI